MDSNTDLKLLMVNNSIDRGDRMPEFKVVVGDPEASRAVRVPVNVIGGNELPYTEEHKEGRKVLEAKINPKTAELVRAPYSLATLRIWKEEGKDKINTTVRLVRDNKVPELTVILPLGFMQDKVGKEKAHGEIFRSKTFQITVRGDKASVFLEKKIGDTIDASVIGISGKKLLITGGSDNTGFPMLKTLPGGQKKKLLLESPPGFRPLRKGERRRKYLRGNIITDEIVQINTKLIS